MKKLFILMLLYFAATPCWAFDSGRYLDNGKVVREAPQEEDILRVNLAYGFSTVLEFAEKPTMVAVGDDALIQVEVPSNSRNVVIKPLEKEGTTNMFVFTPSQRFNYEVAIGEQEDSDYVVNVKRSAQFFESGMKKEDFELIDLIKITKNYPVLKRLGNIPKNLRYRESCQICLEYVAGIFYMDLFQFSDSDDLVAYFSISTADFEDMKPIEQKARIYVNDKAFIPKYVFFEPITIDGHEKTGVWMLFKDMRVSLEKNEFVMALGDKNGEEFKCK